MGRKGETASLGKKKEKRSDQQPKRNIKGEYGRNFKLTLAESSFSARTVCSLILRGSSSSKYGRTGPPLTLNSRFQIEVHKSSLDSVRKIRVENWASR